MEKKYFCINEVIKHFEKMRLYTDFEELCGYIRKEMVHPIIYIDSVPVYAYETIHMKEALAVGFCHLSAYWHIDTNQMISLCDNLLRGNLFKLPNITKEELTQIRMTSWMVQLHYFDEVPKDLICPKAFSKDLAITGFIFPTKNPFYIEIRNIVISENDLEKLATILNKPNSKRRNQAQKANGKLSGKIRAEEAAKKWANIQPGLINIAKSIQPTTPNAIATIAANRKIIPAKAVTNTAKKIREDNEFRRLLKKS